MRNNEQLLEYFLNKVGDFVMVKHYEKNEFIFNEWDIKDSLYIIKSGKVEIFKMTKNWEERIIFILSDGEVLNEEILLKDSSKCSTCCRAYDDTNILIIPRKVVLDCMEEDIKIVRWLLDITNYKLGRTYRQLKNSGTNVTIDKKIASKLYRLALDYGIEKRGEIYIDISLNSGILSKMVGAKRETVSRCLHMLKKEEILIIQGDRITIVNFEKLKLMFENKN